MSKKVNLSSPWQTYVNELTAMFEKDDEVQIIFDESDYEVKIYVSKNYKKAEALDKISETSNLRSMSFLRMKRTTMIF